MWRRAVVELISRDPLERLQHVEPEAVRRLRDDFDGVLQDRKRKLVRRLRRHEEPELWMILLVQLLNLKGDTLRIFCLCALQLLN